MSLHVPLIHPDEDRLTGPSLARGGKSARRGGVDSEDVQLSCHRSEGGKVCW